MVSVVRTLFTVLPLILSVLATLCLIFVIAGDTKAASPWTDIYFLRIRTANIILKTVPKSYFINTAAQSLGLHDYYTVGMWGYCEGYVKKSPRTCSTPQTFYHFDPVAIFQQELLQGYTIDIPSSVQDDLEKVRVASRWMFASYFVAVVSTGITSLIGTVALVSRIASFLAVLTCTIATVFTIIASGIAQITFTVIRNAFTSEIKRLNVPANLGTPIFSLTWVAAGANLLALVGFAISGCCSNRLPSKKT